MTGIGAVLFDRDGTLIVDVPYNGDADRVAPIPGAIEAVGDVRRRGLATGIVSNQSGLARGKFDRGQLVQVNRRVDQLFGLFDVWCVCPHGPDQGCRCRKPAPGLVIQASAQLGLPPRQVVVVGDRVTDMQAARAAGAIGVLVPSPTTEAEAHDVADRRLTSIADLGPLVDLYEEDGE